MNIDTQCGKRKVKRFLLHNVQGEYRAVKALKWFATESCIQLIWHDNDKNHKVCHAKTVQNPI